jgi:hypothetical protein
MKRASGSEKLESLNTKKFTIKKEMFSILLDMAKLKNRGVC